MQKLWNNLTLLEVFIANVMIWHVHYTRICTVHSLSDLFYLRLSDLLSMIVSSNVISTYILQWFSLPPILSCVFLQILSGTGRVIGKEERESYWRKEMVGKGYSREMREEKFVLCVKLSLRRFYVWRYVVITLFYDLKKSYFYTGNVVEIKNNKNCCW